MPIGDELGQPFGLVPAFEDRGAEMDVVEMQRVAADVDVRALHRTALRRSSTTDRAAMWLVIGKRLRTTLPNWWPRSSRAGAMTQPMPSAAPISSMWLPPRGPAPMTS